MKRLTLIATLSLMALCPGPGDNVYKVLDHIQSAKEIPSAIRQLKDLSPVALIHEIREGRTWKEGKAGQTRTKLTDGYDRTTDLYTVIPESYTPSKPAGVLVLLHGLGGNGRQLIGVFKSFAEENNMIIISPSAKKGPQGLENDDVPSFNYNALPHWWVNLDHNFIFSALSRLKKSYNIDENRVVLTGYSMGGFGTWGIGLRFPDRFAALMPFAGGVSRKEYTGGRDDMVRHLLVNAFELPIHITHGDRDRTVNIRMDRMSAEDLKALGYDFHFEVVKGAGHMMNIRPGSALYKEFTGWVKTKKRTPFPKEIAFSSLGNYMNHAYWVRLDRMEKGAVITAKIKSNTIEAETDGVSKITFFLNNKLVDLSKTVTVNINGKEVFSKKVRLTKKAVLESWLMNEDRVLLYPAKVTINLE